MSEDGTSMSEDNPWWERLDVEPPEESGKEQEDSAPADDAKEAEGEKERNANEPARTAAEQEGGAQPPKDGAPAEREGEIAPEPQATMYPRGATAAEQPRNDKNDGAHDGGTQPPEERAEQERMIREEESAKNAEKLKAVFASLGLKDGEGKPIETMEQFDEYQSEQRTRRIQRDLKNGSLTPEALREAVLEAPEVRQVLQQAQNATANAQRAEREARTAQFSANMQRELAEIRKLNPAIKSTDDIIRMDTGPEYARLLRGGLRPSEAYKLANFDSIRDRERGAAEQAARNAAASKSHLQSTPTTGGQALAVPKEYAQQLRRFVPELTDKEIAQYYARQHKNN